MKYVLDTTAFSALMRRDEMLLPFLKCRHANDFVTVPPVVAEIESGIRRLEKSSKKYVMLNSEKKRILNVIEVLPWNSEASKHFGMIKAELERQGNLIDDFDIAIGAIAISHQCAVLTANIKHFKRISALQSLSWLS